MLGAIFLWTSLVGHMWSSGLRNFSVMHLASGQGPEKGRLVLSQDRTVQGTALAPVRVTWPERSPPHAGLDVPNEM